MSVILPAGAAGPHGTNSGWAAQAAADRTTAAYTGRGGDEPPSP